MRVIPTEKLAAPVECDVRLPRPASEHPAAGPSGSGLVLAFTKLMHTAQMIEATPAEFVFSAENLSAGIDACFDCAQACSACADACLGETDVAALRKCIRLNQDCAEICLVTASLLTRQQEPELALVRRLLELCRLAATLCADECENHAARHEHCRVCAETCRGCVRACHEALGALYANVCA